MTGVARNNMTYVNNRKTDMNMIMNTKLAAGLYSLPGILLAAMLPASAMAATSGSTTITGTIVTNPCNVTVPPTVTLGNLIAGTTNEKTSFDIGVTCSNTNSNYLVYASLGAKGENAGAETVNMVVGGSVPSSNKTTLQLLKGNAAIKLDGSGSTVDNAAFCTGNDTQTCTLKAKVMVPAAAATGTAEAIIGFTLRYS